jgi:hypothetical protein
MKNSIVADGHERMKSCGDFQPRLLELRAEIQARHAEELMQAGFFRRILIRRRIEAEFRRERMDIEPSKYSLYGSGSAG